MTRITLNSINVWTLGMPWNWREPSNMPVLASQVRLEWLAIATAPRRPCDMYTYTHAGKRLYRTFVHGSEVAGLGMLLNLLHWTPLPEVTDRLRTISDAIESPLPVPPYNVPLLRQPPDML